MTKEQIQMLPTNELRAIVASTSPTGSKWVELCLARNELARREAALVPYVEVDQETAYGSTQRMQRSIRVF